MYGAGTAWVSIDQLAAASEAVWTLTYRAGELGVDDSGEIIIARRDVCDSAIPQFSDPWMPGFVKVSGDVDAVLTVRYIPNRYIRPWKSCISITVSDGSLAPGDEITVQFGAAEGEGLPYRIQTFTEEEHLFRVMADSAGSGVFYDVEHTPSIRITGGPMDRIHAVFPSHAEPGKPCTVRLRAVDRWGNIADAFYGTVRLMIENREIEAAMEQGLGEVRDVKFSGKGVYHPQVADEDGNIIGEGNPVICDDPQDMTLFWGDMHGQTKETVGTGTLDGYFSFARDKSFLDFSSWQGNDFQVTDETWERVCEAVRRYHAPGEFITFLGYEWSGTTPVGGDYNIYYLGDEGAIHRSSHWQIGMESRDGSDRSPISELWKEFEGRNDVMAVPHVGGRYGNLDYADPRFVHLLEIHSHHGTFEWLFEDALKKGLHLGIIAASDDHTCRPGLSYPTETTSRGFVSFSVTGGYTGVYAEQLTRESIWEALKERRCCGTTGKRIVLQVSCGDAVMGQKISVEGHPEISVRAAGEDCISEVELKRDAECIYRYSDTLPVMKQRVKLQWSGVRVRSRSKKTRWDGSLRIENGEILQVHEGAFNDQEEGITAWDSSQVSWKSSTSGDIDYLLLDLESSSRTKLHLSCLQAEHTLAMEELESGRVVIDAGGVNNQMEFSLARDHQARKETSFCFRDEHLSPGMSACYWVKVVQQDGHMAWSSPILIHRKVQ